MIIHDFILLSQFLGYLMLIRADSRLNLNSVYFSSFIMKVVLINLSQSEKYDNWEETSGVWPPLGLMYIASTLEKAGHEVTLIDANAMRLNKQEITHRIVRIKPELVGISAMTPLVYDAYALSEMIKKEIDVKILLGGAHPTSMPDETIKNEFVDFIALGESEEIIVNLVKAIEAKKSFKDINGIYWKDETGKITKNKRCAYIEDLDNLPFPAWNLVKMKKYKTRSYADNGKPWFSILSSRGCPSLCNFCNAWMMMGRKPRARSPENVVEELRELKKRYGVGNFCFVDSTLTIDKERVHKICDLMIAEKLDMNWQCETRVTVVDEPLLRKMYQAGCRYIDFGIESGDPQILKNIKKGITPAQALKAVRLAQKVGLHVLCSFIIGHSGETRETAMRTINFAKKLNPEMAFFFSLTPFPGTEVWDEFANRNNIISYDWSQYSIGYGGNPPVVETDSLSKEDIAELVSLAHRKYYFRIGYFLRNIRFITNFRMMRRMFGSFLQVVKISFLKKKH